MRLASFEKSYTKQTPVTFKVYKITLLESPILTLSPVWIWKFGELPLQLSVCVSGGPYNRTPHSYILDTR